MHKFRIQFIYILFISKTTLNQISAALSPNTEPDPVCSLPPESGNCRTLIHRWYFKVDVGQCREFVWGGCNDGNENRFIEKKDCERRCLRSFTDGANEFGPDIKPSVINSEKTNRQALSYRLPIDPEEVQNKIKGKDNTKGQAFLNKQNNYNLFSKQRSNNRNRYSDRKPKSKYYSHFANDWNEDIGLHSYHDYEDLHYDYGLLLDDNAIDYYK